MRNFIIAAVSFIILLLIASPCSAYASYEQEEAEISSQVEGLLADYGIGYGVSELSGMTFGEIMGELRRAAAERAEAPLKMLAALLIVSVFTAVVRSAGESILPSDGASQMYDMVCVITAVTVITPQLTGVYGRSLEAIERLGCFIMVFVPVLAGIMIVSGSITSGGFYNIAAVTASEMIVGLSRSYLVPVLGLSAVLAVSGSVFPNASVEGFLALMKKFMTWGMTVVMTLFTGFVTLRCTLASKADGAATKTAKFMISGFVPVVGSAVSDAYSTVRGSFDVIGGTVGTAGIIAVTLIMLAPVAELVIYRAVMWIGAAAAEMFSAAPLVKLLKGLDSGLAIAQSVLICYTVMFIISTAILIQ
ncbi:MAG: hypothetical protein IKO47_11110 [Ruminococcus sp.]|nr:hypothetical protein [Ruminococcus sp.]